MVPRSASSVSSGVAIAAALTDARAQLVAAGIETAALDARVLLAHVTGLTHQQLIIEDDRTLSEKQDGQLRGLLARRINHEPIAYLTGHREFFGQTYTVTPDTLVPRPDTEVLVEAALAFCRTLDHPARILDLGTGSGAILLALLTECGEASGVGVDKSQAALGVASANAQALGLEARVHFICTDWFEGVTETFDLIVSNPPYITDADMAGLMPDVANFEPVGALNGGPDGLDPLRIIATGLRPRLHHPGLFCVEIGLGQEDAAKSILADAGLGDIDCVPDLNRIPRCVRAFTPGSVSEGGKFGKHG